VVEGVPSFVYVEHICVFEMTVCKLMENMAGVAVKLLVTSKTKFTWRSLSMAQWLVNQC
jgi:hypothetical protein